MCEHVPNKGVCIEIGTFQGVSALVLSEIFEKVYTFDIEKQPMTDEIINYFPDHAEKIETCIVSSRADEVKKVKPLVKIADMVFIDGEHFHGELKRDFKMVSGCPCILIHDYAEDFPEVYNLVNNIKGYRVIKDVNFALLIKE
jgi:hypothetical protein